MRGSIALAALLMMAACGDSPEESEISDPEKVVAGETHEEFDERRDELEGEAGSYAGYGCTVDCSGHEAGYQWAAENDITDPDDCGGKSWSFIEGCRAYAEENGDY